MGEMTGREEEDGGREEDRKERRRWRVGSKSWGERKVNQRKTRM